jgi:ADP-heptose:LPS heptosyltransferase
MIPLNIQSQNESLWKDDVTKRDFKPVSASIMRALGLKRQNVKYVETLESLRDDPPNIVVAEAVRNVKFVQNWFKEQHLKKKVRYVMGLGVFQQLYLDYNGNKILKPSTLKFKNMYRPYLGQNAEGCTILVFRTGGIGDLLFIQPNLRYLKENYDCKIQFACGPQYQPMVETWDCVDEVLDLPFSAKTLLDADYHMLFEGVIERCKESEIKNAYELFTTWLGLDLPDEKLIPKQEPKEDLVEECRKILDGWGILEDGFILMQLRASSPIRTPRHQFWIKLVNELTKRGHNVILTDNPRQADNIQDFINLCADKDKVFNFCKHSVSIDWTIALTSFCNMTLATDSALGHIACSLDKKCFGIYGPFPGKIRLRTYPKADWIDADRHCAPCFLHGHKPCKYSSSDGYSPCYDELIDTDKKLIGLIDNIERFLND